MWKLLFHVICHIRKTKREKRPLLDTNCQAPNHDKKPIKKIQCKKQEVEIKDVNGFTIWSILLGTLLCA
jgi:hypothetical protein